MTTGTRRLAVGLVAMVTALARRGGAQADTMTTSFQVNGLNVILRRSTSNDVVTANVYLLGGTQQLSPATQGIELMLLRASEYGTQRFPGDLGRQVIARLGSVVTIAPAEDWTVFGFTSVYVAAAGIAKVLFFVFLVLFIISLISGGVSRRGV